MNGIDELLRDLADTCPPPRDPAAVAVREGRALRRRRVLVAASAAAVLAVGGGAAALAVRSVVTEPAIDGSVAGPPAFAAWPARGDLAANADVAPAAARAWGAGHHSVTVLYAGRNHAGNGPEPIVVVAAARDARGRERIGWFTASGETFDATTALVRRAETAAPPVANTQDLGVVVRLSGDWVAFALAAPGNTVAVAAIAGEDVPQGTVDPEGELVERTMSGPTTQVTIDRDGQFVATHDLG
jgi:hypothetical protein